LGFGEEDVGSSADGMLGGSLVMVMLERVNINEDHSCSVTLTFHTNL
jgi:hypothetical protein